MAVRHFVEWAREMLDLAADYHVVIADEDQADVPDDRVDRFVERVEPDESDNEVCVYAADCDAVPEAPISLAQFLQMIDELPEACRDYALIESIRLDVEDIPYLVRLDRGIRASLVDRARRRVCLLAQPIDPDALEERPEDTNEG